MSDKTLIEWNADVGTRFLTIYPDGSFHINENTPPLYALGELAKAFMKQQDRIKRLEEALKCLTLVVGLTPIAGNKDALQEAMDIAISELQAKEDKL